MAVEKKKQSKNISKKKKLNKKANLPFKTLSVKNQEQPKSINKSEKSVRKTLTISKMKKDGNKPVISPKPSNQGENSNEPILKSYPDWTKRDLLILATEVINLAPETDDMKFVKRSYILDWNKISSHLPRSAENCKKVWAQLQCKGRGHRILREVLNDAKLLLQRSTETMIQEKPIKPKLSDAPEQPKNEFDFFFIDMKTQIQKKNPNIKTAQGSKYVATLFRKLPEEKKQKYIKMAEEERKKSV